MQKIEEKPDTENVPDGLVFIPSKAPIPPVSGNVQIRRSQSLAAKDRVIFPKDSITTDGQLAPGFLVTEASGS